MTKVRLCLLGAGRAAKVHANSLVKNIPDGELTAFVDTDPEALHSTADQFGKDSRFPTLEEALVVCTNRH